MNKTITVTTVERLNNTVNGNPRYKVHGLPSQGAYVTQSDNNHVYSGIYDRLDLGDIVNLELTPAGRIKNITVLEED